MGWERKKRQRIWRHKQELEFQNPLWQKSKSFKIIQKDRKSKENKDENLLTCLNGFANFLKSWSSSSSNDWDCILSNRFLSNGNLSNCIQTSLSGKTSRSVSLLICILGILTKPFKLSTCQWIWNKPFFLICFSFSLFSLLSSDIARESIPHGFDICAFSGIL